MTNTATVYMPPDATTARRFSDPMPCIADPPRHVKATSGRYVEMLMLGTSGARVAIKPAAQNFTSPTEVVPEPHELSAYARADVHGEWRANFVEPPLGSRRGPSVARLSFDF
jgi:hypothetical protein